MPEPEAQPARPTATAEPYGPPLCKRCNYNLTGLPDQSLCPECAEPIDLRRYRKTWPDALLESKTALAWACLVAALGHIMLTGSIVHYIYTLRQPFLSEGMVELSPFFAGALSGVGTFVIGLSLIGIVTAPDVLREPPESKRVRAKAVRMMVITVTGICVLCVLGLLIAAVGPLLLLVAALPIATLLASITYVINWLLVSWLGQALHAMTPSKPANHYTRRRWLLFLGPPGAAMLMLLLGISLLTINPEPNRRAKSASPS